MNGIGLFEAGRRFGALVAVLAAALVPAARADDGWCHPSPEVAEAMFRLDRGNCSFVDPCYEEQLKAARDVAAEHPEDLFARQLVVGAEIYLARDDDEALDGIRQKYRCLHEADPGDPVALYLYAFAFVGESDEGKQVLDRLVEIAPDFAPGRILRAARRGFGKGREVDDLVREDLAAALRLCPDAPRAILPASYELEREAWSHHVPGLRRYLEGASAWEQLRWLEGLWQLEFKLAPTEQHEELRSKVLDDMERVEGLKLEDLRSWWQLLRKGYELAGEEAALDRVMSAMMERFPCEEEAVAATHQKWTKVRLGDLSVHELHRLLHRTDEWLESCPEAYLYRTDRLRVLRELASRGATPGLFLQDAAIRVDLEDPYGPEGEHRLLDDLTDAAILHEVDQALAMWDRERGRQLSTPSPYLLSASLLLRRDLQPERALGLIDKERKQLDEWREKQPLAIWPEELRPRLRHQQLTEDSRLLLRRAEALIKLGRPDDATEVLERIPAVLAGIDLPQRRVAVARAEGEYWALKAALAMGDRRFTDALSFFVRAEAADPRLLEQSRAAQMFVKLGGTEEGWEAMKALHPPPELDRLAWEDRSEPVVPFELEDLDGRVWRSKDLAGKTVLINLWATWCGPCQGELPYVQKLADEVAGREDVLVLTLNLDENPGRVRPFLKREGLSLTTLLANDYWEAHLPGYRGIPQLWLVDRDGIIRKTRGGFCIYDAPEWMNATLPELEALAEH